MKSDCARAGPDRAVGAAQIQSIPGAACSATPKFLVGDESRVGHFLPELRRIDFLFQREAGCFCQKVVVAQIGLPVIGPAPDSLRCQNRRTGPFIQPIK